MRLFRDEEAARKAGFIFKLSDGDRRWMEGYGIGQAEALSDRERALLEALEAVLPAAHYCEMPEPGEREAIRAAENLINSMNVEG